MRGHPLTSAQTALLVGQSEEIETPAWAALLAEQRIQLMEVCCSPKSILSEVVDNKLGAGSAVRLGSWNGYDLTTKDGLAKARAERKHLRPKDRWVSTPCGPWSQMQKINHRTPDQRARLAEKRRRSYEIIVAAAI